MVHHITSNWCVMSYSLFQSYMDLANHDPLGACCGGQHHTGNPHGFGVHILDKKEPALG